MTREQREVFQVESLVVPYARPDGHELTLHISRPVGQSNCPTLLDIHGGAWTYFDHTVDFYWCRELARRGCLVASAEFRQAPQYPWPHFLSDLRAAARWLRAHATKLGGNSQSIGSIGGSTGGHLAAMLGLWPRDTHHPVTAALDVTDEADAHVDFVVALWPILDVPGRYRLVNETRFDAITSRIVGALLAKPGSGAPPSAASTTQRLARIDSLRQRHKGIGDAFAACVQTASTLGGMLPLPKALLYNTLARAHEGAFASLAEMEEASPLHLLSRGGAQQHPPILVVQGERDTNMTVAMTTEFAQEYRKQGGSIDVEIVSGQGHSFGNIPSQAADDLIDKVSGFIRRCHTATRLSTHAAE